MRMKLSKLAADLSQTTGREQERERKPLNRSSRGGGRVEPQLLEKNGRLQKWLEKRR